jgi:hypothetical protein
MHLTASLSCLALLAMLGMAASACSEEFQDVAPFPESQETITLDGDDFVTIAREAELLDGQPVFAIRYQVFDELFEGYLTQSQERVYVIEAGASFEDRVPFFDLQLQPGDTLHKYTPRRYHIVIDRRPGPQQDEIQYILRRTRRGISDLEERQIWVMSSTRGMLAAARYEIDPFSGAVSLDMIGDAEWFRDGSITQLIKRYDHIRTIYMDRDRSLMYEFNKLGGYLRCRDVMAREEIYRYDFENRSMAHLTDFRLEAEPEGILLRAGDSCFHFTPSLQLQASGKCP